MEEANEIIDDLLIHSRDVIVSPYMITKLERLKEILEKTNKDEMPISDRKQ